MGIGIVLAIAFLVLTIIGFVMTFVAADKVKINGKKTFNAKAKTMLIMALIGLAGLILVPQSIFSISTGEIGLVRVFGEAKETINPGIHFKLWISNTVEVYDIKTREITLEFQAYSKDAQTVTGQLSVQYQIMPDMIMEINGQYGSTEILEEKIKAIILERAKSVFSDKGAMLIVESRSALSGEIEERIVPVLDQYYVTLSTVALKDISFNDAFETAVEQKMVAEQEKLRAEYDKEKAVIKAEEQLEVADREAQATIRRAEGDAESLRIMQDAWATLSPEVKEAMLQQMFYEKWNGILPEVMAGDSLDIIYNRATE